MVFTVERETPLAAAILRRLECVASGGFSSSVLRTISSTWAWVILFLTPGLGLSFRAARRPVRKRLRHFSTVCSRMSILAPIAA
jgi:predicted Na+-dependent transporter